METKKQSKSKGISAGWIILGSAIVAAVFFFGVCGHDSHFDDKGHPIQGDFFGILYQGGYVIPMVITLLLTVLTLSIERLFALNRASGKAKNEKFVVAVKQKIDAGDIAGAIQLSDEQKGSIANIVREGLVRYDDVEDIPNITNSDKAELIQKEIDEATTLELPYLEKNLNIIAAISTLGTLFGLFGTVLGMIRAFSAMGHEGAPDSTALAVGISEALMNTALGIGTGALAIITYTYFNGRITTMTNAIDEIGFAIGQSFIKRHGGLAK
ncbi:MotA/TolQ/ExbB proton channel family protein [Proteiniphilum sp.]|uniref:MotA/TolQ/ExbB proton channel family protein n=1 Tax=Proteiniphilum sp. TaxID=1926877 RepID=UPI002B20F8B1|nr:MotA/TolQ/ExbB proton channel family protein [Proteiniphilum sp.]MEA4918512.1 MotA/TolQ/ExbB proton channel family protein [Proteiniphilum sp.]